jgi:hypothetical protein
MRMKMDTSKIKVNGIRLDVIMKHYRNIDILIYHALETRNFGGQKALDAWDKERTKKGIVDLEITIDEILSPVIIK